MNGYPERGNEILNSKGIASPGAKKAQTLMLQGYDFARKRIINQHKVNQAWDAVQLIDVSSPTIPAIGLNSAEKTDLMNNWYKSGAPTLHEVMRIVT